MLREKERVKAVLERLEELYPEAKTALNFSTPFQLLVAVVLSARSTDRQVNEVTRDLFAKYPGPAEMAAATPEEMAAAIKGVGLNKAKGKYLVELAQKIVEEYGGEVPASWEELLRLPGVGRKTAGVVLSNAFQLPAFPVDTHVFRVSRRLGLASGTTPEAVEKELEKAVPPELWGVTHHRLIYHGRQVCRARKPLCESCRLADLCPRKGVSSREIKEKNRGHTKSKNRRR